MGENDTTMKTKVKTKMKTIEKNVRRKMEYSKRTLFTWFSLVLLIGVLVTLYLVGAYKDDYYWTNLQWSFDLSISRFYIIFGLALLVLWGIIASLYWWFKRAVSAQRTKGQVIRDVVGLETEERELDGSRSTKEMESAYDNMSTIYEGNVSGEISLDSTLMYRGYSHDAVEKFWKGSKTSEQLDPALFYQASSKFISCLSKEQFYSCYSEVEWVVLKKDHTLFRKGDPADKGMFIIVKGSVGGFHEVDGVLEQWSEYRRGDSFEEFSVLMDTKRAMTCIATSDTDLICISRKLFHTFVMKNPNILPSFIRTNLSHQWRSANIVLRHFASIPMDELHGTPIVFEEDTTKVKEAETETETETEPETATTTETEAKTETKTETKTKTIDTDTDTDTATDTDTETETGRKATTRSQNQNNKKKVAEDEAQSCSQDLKGMIPVDSEIFAQLKKSANQKTVSAGNTLFEAGEIDKQMYIVLDGRLIQEDVNDNEVDGESIPVGSVLGAISFFTETSHEYTVRALNKVTVVCLGEADLELDPVRSFLPNILGAVVQTLYTALSQFTRLGFQRSWKHAGEVVYKSGQDADTLYIVVSGRLRSGKFTADGSLKTYFEVSAGECVGEVSFLSEEPIHSHTAVAIRDTELVSISRKAFDHLQMVCPAFVQRVVKIMASRFQSSLGKRRETGENYIKSIALVSVSNSVDLNEFASHLTALLKYHGPALHITKELTESVLGKGSLDIGLYANRSRLTAWLSQQEESHRFLIFESDPADVQWTKVIIKNSDRILIVADANDNPAISDYENALLWQTSARRVLSTRELVLLHPPNTPLPKQTRRWLEPRDVKEHYHVRRGDSRHMERLGRILAGRAWGLVLGGGGARGLAHMGVIKALTEMEIDVDYIGGTSQGSCMAALYAIHEDFGRFEKAVRHLSKRLANIWELLADATFPVMAYFSGKRFNASIKDLVGSTTYIEDLWVKYFCVTTNISEADSAMHTNGCLWKAVRGSMSVLEYLPPMYSDRGLLIDGGYTNNLPVDALRDQWHVDVLVAVDVENKDGDMFSLSRVTDYGEHLSGWWLIASRIWHTVNPFAAKTYVPRFSEIITSLTYINHNRNIRNLIESQLMDIYIRPDLGNTKLLDYHKLEQIVQLGYRYAKNRVVEWKLRHTVRKEPLYKRRRRTHLRKSSSTKSLSLSYGAHINRSTSSLSFLSAGDAEEQSENSPSPSSAHTLGVRKRVSTASPMTPST